MKRPISARELAMDVLVRVEQEKAYSNLLLNQTLQKNDLSKSDAGLMTELVYGTIQRLNTLDYYLSRFISKGVSKLEPWVRNLLRLSFYQIVYLDRIPAHAAVNEAVTIAGKRGHKGISGMVNAVLRNALRRPEELKVPEGLPASKAIALEGSHPEWLVKDWVKQFGEETTRLICESNNSAPHASIRVNPLRLSRERLIERLIEQGFEARASELSRSGIVVTSGGNMAHSPGFENGDFSIQDESSMLVAEVLAPKPGMTVLDCCAAPGGKTAHMAELMEDTGTIRAFDIHEHKKQLIEAQAARLGLRSIHAEAYDAAKLAERFPPASFDRILLDAPCSGLGVIRRKPDLKWAKSKADIAEICRIQAELLRAVSGLLKPGGILVYSTCTLEKEENELAVHRFLTEFPDYQLDAETNGRFPSLQALFIEPGMLRILPHQYGTDGFFIAALRKQV